MSTPMREALMDAYEAVETAEESGEPIARRELEPIVESDPLAPVDASLDDGGDEPLHTETPPEKPAKVAKAPAKVANPPAATKPKSGQPGKAAAAAAVDPTTAPKSKAPQSWKPEVRTHWDKLPADVQAEISRREVETSQVLNQSANSRRFHQDFSTVIRPFETLLLASGVKNPLNAVHNLMATAATLQQGTQAQKANTLANIIKAYGVDIGVLDAVLAGRAPPNGQNPAQNDEILRALDQRLKPVTEFMSRQQQQTTYQQQQLENESQQTIQSFSADEKNEFYEDLREDMADLLDMAAKRGRVMTIQESYDRAAAAHPEISKLMAKKRATEAAQRSKGNVDRARRAAASQPQGTPAAVGAKGASPKGIRGALGQAFDDLSA